jgi:hypothetical protein
MQQLPFNNCQRLKQGMKRSAALPFFLFLLPLVIFFSCSKNNQPDNTILYGKWKTSYGDTILFAHENGIDVLTYKNSLNNALSVVSKNDFSYQHNKLGIKDGLNGPDYRFLQTFTWNQPGTSFTVQGVEWFLFMNSTNTYFTFTKIR